MDHVSCSRSCLRIHYSPASAGLLTITDTLWPYKRPEKDARKKKRREKGEHERKQKQNIGGRTLEIGRDRLKK
jgi:hypothetical protein